MSEDSPGQSSFGRRLFITVRLAAAGFMWANMAMMIGMMKAQAGIPANTPEWNKTWEDYRRWALNPPRFTPIQRLTLKYIIPAILLMYSGFPVRMFTDRFPLILSWGVGCWIAIISLFLIRDHKAAQLGEPQRHRVWALIVGCTFAFLFVYALAVFFTGAVILAMR